MLRAFVAETRRSLASGIIRNDVIVLDTQKTSTRVYVRAVPAAAQRSRWRAGPCGDLAFISTRVGKPFVKEALGDFFRGSLPSGWRSREWPWAYADVRRRRLLRLAQTVAELEAVFGWEGGRMASL